MLKDYQESGVRSIIANEGKLILADEPGLGKTIQCLTAISRANWKPTVVVCPSTAKGVWVEEIGKWLPGVSIDVLEGRRSEYRPVADITILSYDVLGDWLGHIGGWIKPRLVIFDEGHALVNRTTARYKAAKALVCPRKLIVTGTPVLNVREDLSTLRTICGSKVIVRRMKEKVLPDLPKARREIVQVEIDNRREYEYAYTNFLTWLAELGDAERLSAAKRAEGLVRIGYLKRLIANGKLKAVKDFAAKFGQEKVIIFAIHREIVGSLGQGGVIVDGTRTARQRTEAIAAFTQQAGCSRLVANIVSGGTAWNGTASNKVIVAELPWTYAKLEQAEKRIDRIGQTVVPVSYVLLASRTIEERFWQIIVEKRDLSELLLGQPTRPWWKFWSGS